MDTTKIGTFFNTFLLLVAVIGGIYGGYTWVQNQGKEEAVKEELMFPDPETKHRTIIHVTDTEEVIVELKELLRAETKNKEAAVKSRNKRDSIQLEYLKVAEKNSDMIQRNAVSAQQSKQSTDSILKLWDKYNEGNQ